jgi:hypothetical protein
MASSCWLVPQLCPHVSEGGPVPFPSLALRGTWSVLVISYPDPTSSGRFGEQTRGDIREIPVNASRSESDDVTSLW